MATQDYYDWVNSGRHWSDAKPIADLQKSLQALGYTVYTIGDQSHLTKATPEDHTPFSHTGWPNAAPKGIVTALDIMPSKGMADLTRLANAMIAAKRRGDSHAACFKYMNWTDENGNVKHISWEPDEKITSSTDSGHIHLSIRTDYVNSDCCAGWNLVGGVSNPAPSSPPSSSHPAPGPALSFPLPRGYYFGPKNGPDSSVSGYYNRTFNGHPDKWWLEQWANQLGKRGWSVGKGKSYLTVYGNNGEYGPEYEKLIKAFQADQHLAQDGELGINTWNAAYHNPVT